MTRTLGIALLSLLVSAPALAAEEAKAAAAPAAAAPAPAPTAVKAGAADLARLLVPKEGWSRSMAALAQDAQGRMQSHPGSQLTFPADFGSKVRGEVEKVLPYEDLIGMQARELSATYSEKELGELVAFFKAGTGQKFLKVMPEVGGKVEAATQQRFQQKMPDVMKTLTAGLKHPDPATDKAMVKPAAPAKPAEKAPTPAPAPAPAAPASK
jgi:hypothetical protein